MSVERTLSIIKPDAVAKSVIGKILARFEENDLRIAAMQMLQLTRQQAEDFYGIHRGKPFYEALVNFMVSGPVVVSVLEGEDAVALNRKLMGATNPAQAEPGTIRADYAASIDNNAVHGSDSVENAAIEVKFFFPEL